MRGMTGSALRAAFVVALLATTAPTAPSLEAGARLSGPRAVTQDAPAATCCFTNPRYAGTCEVVPAKDESCGGILAYLNNPMSQGKSYCGNTTIRGGWQSVACAARK